MLDQPPIPLPPLVPRSPAAHKGDFGRVLVVGGSRGMAGAPALAGMAALRSGAGLVTVAVPADVQDVVAGFSPLLMTVGLAASAATLATTATRDLADRADAVALGPGWGRGATAIEIALRLCRELSAPMVIDADALFALSTHPDALGMAVGPRVLTPHAGEFQRLAGRMPGFSDNERVAAARDLANRGAGRWVVLLKGHRTVVTDGERVVINSTGNPGMATGGSGDVLTGVIAALVAQGHDTFAAAQLGAHVHGLAGDLAAAALGQRSLVATDLLDCLPAAWRQLESAV